MVWHCHSKPLKFMCGTPWCCRNSSRYLMPFIGPVNVQEPSYRHDWVLPSPWHCHHQNDQFVARSLEHVSINIYKHMCVHQHVIEENENHLNHKTNKKTQNNLSRVHLILFCHHCRRSAKWRGVKTLGRPGLLGRVPTSHNRLPTGWSEILRSPGIRVTVVVAVVVRFRITHPDVSTWSLGPSLTLWVVMYGV